MTRSSKRTTTPMFNDSVRLTCVRYWVCGGFAAALLLAPQLWLDDTFFGCVAVFSNTFRLRAPLDWMFLLAIGGLLIPIAATRHPKRWIYIWCLVFLARVVWDRLPWQPYFFQYFVMLLVIGWPAAKQSPGAPSQPSSYQTARQLNCLRLIMVAIYFWSGVSKFNFMFLSFAVPMLIGPWLPAWMSQALQQVSWVLPTLEILIALGLVFRCFRPWAVMGGIAMHLSILIMIGPWGLNYNQVVWPWNVVMMVLLPTLFWKSSATTAKDVMQVGRQWVSRLVFFLFVVAPGLSYVGLYPDTLSFKLYSGNSPNAYIFVSKDLLGQLPEDVRKACERQTDSFFAARLELNQWSESRLGAVAPPERRVFLHVARRFCAFSQKPDDFTIVLVGAPNIFSGRSTTERLNCGEF